VGAKLDNSATPCMGFLFKGELGVSFRLKYSR
jgi:hypothetical protein